MSNQNQSFQLDTVAVHMALLKSGKAIMFTGDDKKIWDLNRGKSSLWDPNNPNDKKNPHLGRNLFCCGHCFLPDGRLFVAGGQSTVHRLDLGLLSFLGILQIFVRGADHDIHTFDPNEEKWIRHKGMPKARWYPTCVTLPDGKAMIVSGIYSQAHNFVFKNSFINLDYEIFDPTTNTLSKPKPFLKEIKAYPFLQVLPGGTLFVHYQNATRLWNILTKEFYPKKFLTKLSGTRTYPGIGSCTLLPLIPGKENFKILIVGGSTEISPNDDTPATNKVEIFEFNPNDPNASSGWHDKSPTIEKRFLSDSILLPDGTVLVTNGAARGTSDHNHDAVRTIELFDPKNETWRKVGSIQKDRLYHCTAILLHDGRVVIGGSTGHDWPPKPEDNEKSIEIFRPPYLDGNPIRPIINSAPATIGYDSTFEISISSEEEIDSVVLIRLSSTTHNNNMDQRYVGLSILEKHANLMKVKSPKNGTYAPPGYYMLFLLNDHKIPSVAKFVRIG
ncbi:MAG: galactose oxidase-like domain-containing protein [Nitrosopumilaceae archaeon]